MRLPLVIVIGLLVGLVAAPVSGQTVDRLAGASRQQTAAAVATAAYDRAEVVYLAEEGTQLPDALAAGMLTDGPTLLVPADRPADPVVAQAVDALDPSNVLVLGSVIGPDVAEGVAGGRPVEQLGGVTRDSVVSALADRFGPSADAVYLARSDDLADGLAGGTLQRGPLVLLEDDGTVSDTSRETIGRVSPQEIVALGGALAVGDAALATAASAAGGVPTRRLQGPSRFETAAAIAQEAFPTSAETVYLSRADIAPDAAVGGALADGPILLLQSCEDDGTVPPTHPATAAELQRIQPSRIVALGGTAAICDAAVDATADSVTPPLPKLTEESLLLSSSDFYDPAIYRHDLATGTTTMIVEGSSPSLSFDRTRIAYTTRDQIINANIDGTDASVVAEKGNDTAVEAPTFSPDGSKLAYLRTTDEYYPNLGYYISCSTIIIRDLQTQQERGLFAATNLIYDMEWSPDGSHLIFNRSLPNMTDGCGQSTYPDDFGLWRVDADGTGARSLGVPEGFDPEYNPDGSRLVWRDRRNTCSACGEVWTASAGLADQRALATTEPLSTGADFSPDGGRIAYIQSDYSTWTLVITDLDGAVLTSTPIADGLEVEWNS